MSIQTRGKLVGDSGLISSVTFLYGSTQHTNSQHTSVIELHASASTRASGTLASLDKAQSEATTARRATHAASIDPWHPHTTIESDFLSDVGRNFVPKTNVPCDTIAR